MNAQSDRQEPPLPPQAPEIDRKIMLRPGHVASLVLLLALVVPALAGLFDTKTTEVRRTVGSGDVVVTYPAQLRVLNKGVVEIRLEAPPDDSLRVELDDEYLRHFGTYSYADYLPSITARPATWRLELEASRIGRASGSLRVGVAGDVASFDLHTIILP